MEGHAPVTGPPHKCHDLTAAQNNEPRGEGETNFAAKTLYTKPNRFLSILRLVH